MKAYYRTTTERFQSGTYATSIDWVFWDSNAKDKLKPWKIFAWDDGYNTDRELAVYNYDDLSQLPDLEKITRLNLRQLIKFVFKAKYE
jgi:hypothetical protein